jgi:hypothetical protein
MESTPGPGGPSPSGDPNDGDPSATTVHRRLRALRRLLRRLGLLDVLGRDWARVDAETKRITFGDVPEGRDELLILHLEDLLDDKLPPAPGFSNRTVGKFATSAVTKPFTPKSETVGPHLGGKA